MVLVAPLHAAVDQSGECMKYHFLASVIAALVSLAPMSAQALDAPRGKVILTIHGKVTHPNVGETAQFDLEMLEALSGREAAVDTPWIKEKVTFSGPFLRSVLTAAGARGESMRISAINDYSAEVPFEDAKLDTILATRMNGKVMAVRDKGPIFLVYPFDKDRDLYNEMYFNRSVWQIDEIEIR
jgi:hypothetical protein